MPNTAWLIGERVFSMGLGLIVGVALARYLGPEDYGRFSFLRAAVAFVGPLSSLGLAGIVTRELANRPEREGEILGTVVALRVLGALAAVCLLWATTYVGGWFPDEDRNFLLALGAGPLRSGGGSSSGPLPPFPSSFSPPEPPPS